MKYAKITDGYVYQVFEDGKCVSQQFFADDTVEYEDVETGEQLDSSKMPHSDYPFTMVQPDDHFDH